MLGEERHPNPTRYEYVLAFRQPMLNLAVTISREPYLAKKGNYHLRAVAYITWYCCAEYFSVDINHHGTSRRFFVVAYFQPMRVSEFMILAAPPKEGLTEASDPPTIEVLLPGCDGYDYSL